VSRDVLLVAHGAERGGPTRLLLSFLRWMREHTDLEVELGLLQGGELLDELAELVPVHLLEEVHGAPVEDVDRRRSRRTLRRHCRHLDGFRLTYVNTMWTTRALRYLPEPRRLLLHVHELDLGIGHLVAAEDRRRAFGAADRVVVGCRAVHDLLVERHHVPPDRIADVPYFLVEEPRGFPGGGRARRSALGIPPDAAVVGTVAMSDWRKGPDLLLEAAWHLQRMVPDREVHVVWVGGPSPGGHDATPTSRDVAALGLTGRVHLVGAQRAVWDWYRAFDVFALPSREDAFPLACLEAGAVGVPTVAFDTGGIADLVQDDAGRIVPFPRVDLLAAALAELLVDDDARARAGAAAAARVRQEHDRDRRAAQLAAEVERLVRS
jgi:glycosyltransferase involved in cell wall biosynthesis